MRLTLHGAGFGLAIALCAFGVSAQAVQPRDVRVPLAAEPAPAAGGMAVVRITLRLPRGAAVDVTTDDGQALGAIRSFGPAGQVTYTLPLPRRATARRPAAIVLRPRSPNLAGSDLAVARASLAYLS